MKNNIFDVSSVDDLPQELKKELKKKNLNANDGKILELFFDKNDLTIDEILIGLYRKHKVIQKRSWVSNRLFSLSKAGKIKKVRKGVYAITIIKK